MERRQCRRSPGRMLMENTHFVAFRTWGLDSCCPKDPFGRGAGSLRTGMELAGQKALLTGATGGLGRAIAEALAARGATVLLSARKADALEALAASLPGGDHRV